MVYGDVEVALIEIRFVYNITKYLHSLESFCTYAEDNLGFGEVNSVFSRASADYRHDSPDVDIYALWWKGPSKVLLSTESGGNLTNNSTVPQQTSLPIASGGNLFSPQNQGAHGSVDGR